MKLSKKITRIASFGILLLAAQNAAADLIYSESFTGGTLGASTSITGGGISGNSRSFWTFYDANTNTPNLAYTPGGNDGSLWGGRDLARNFGGQAGAGAQRLITVENFDLSTETSISVSIELSANPGNRFEANDFVELFYRETTSDPWTSLDVFSGPTTGSGVLSNGVVDLGDALQTLSYNITLSGAGAADGFGFRVQAFTNRGAESLALDNINIFDTAVPEPSPLALFGLSLFVLGFIRRKRL